jgi:Peptidase C10 family/Spi protease inhibitor
MKKLFIVLFFLVLSCKQETVQDAGSSKTDASLKSIFGVSEDEALGVSSNYLTNSVLESKKARIRGNESLVDFKDKKVKKVKKYFDEANEVVYYTINYEGGGFSIISGDKRMTPVLAFSETNGFENDTLAGVKDWLAFTKKIIVKVKKDVKEPSKSVIDEWNFYSNKSKNGRFTAACSTPVIYETGQFVSNIATWGQSYEYQYYSPVDNGCGLCKKKWAGCGPVAAAMVVRYFQKQQVMTVSGATLTTNFGTMPQNPYYGDCSEQGDYIKQIAMLIRWCGIKVSANYGVLGNCNTWTIPGNINNGFTSMGFTSGGTWGSLNSSKYISVKSDLKAFYPVVFTGTLNVVNAQDAHIWLGDGYKSSTCGTAVTEWIGMNWGWTGSNNGYFIADYSFATNENGSVNNGTYDTYLRALTGIRANP